MYMIVHNCVTQYSTKQFWSSLLSSRLQTIIIAQMLSNGGEEEKDSQLVRSGLHSTLLANTVTSNTHNVQLIKTIQTNNNTFQPPLNATDNTLQDTATVLPLAAIVAFSL